jgi:hypothetical protein
MPKVFDNPLIHPIRLLLAEADRVFSEHELIKCLQADESAFPALAGSPWRALFQTHFLVMNALYRLQEQLFDENIHLHISPLEIFFQPLSEVASNALAENSRQSALKRYYSDWEHFQATDEQDVEHMLGHFWQHYLAPDKQVDAYRVLQLEPGATWSVVQEAYRRMASLSHPDRGGDAAEFMLVREAYEVLSKTEGAPAAV